MEALISDVRVAVRGFRRRPGLNLVSTLTLALGIGGVTGAFSVVDTVLLKPLPYSDPDRLAVVRVELPKLGRFGARASGPEIAAIWDHARSFEKVGSLWARPGVLRGGDGPASELEAGWITPGFMESLGVAPHLGRLPTREELISEKPDVIVLGFELWQQRYAADPGILGKRISFDGESWTVIGVMGPGLRMLFPPDEGVPEKLAAWLPWGGNAYREMSRGFRVFTTVARLAPGVSIDSAAADLRRVAEGVRSQSNEYAASGFGFRVESLAEGAVAHVRTVLLVLAVVVAFVLLVACANITNLSLAQAAELGPDFAVRAALGASRRRLWRQILTGSIILGSVGAAIGLGLAGAALEFLKSIEPGRLPRIEEIDLDRRAVAMAATASFLAALISGGIAAARSIGLTIPSSLHLEVRGATRPRSFLRGPLVVSQIAVSLVLLVGAGLILRSAVHLAQVDPGFDPRNVLTLRLSLPDVDYSYREQGAKIADFYRRLDASIGSLPGVEQVGATLNPPLSGLPIRTRPFTFRSAAGEGEWGSMVARYSTVTPGWFKAARVRLTAGRFLEPADDRNHPLAVVVNTTLARRAWPGDAAIGQPIRVEVFRDGTFGPAWGEVVGVVEPVKMSGLEIEDGDQLYLAHAQAPQRTMFLTVRTSVPPLSLVSSVQARVESIEKDLPVFDVRLAEEHVAHAMALTRFALWTLAAFAGLAAALASAGVYSVMSFMVGQKRREFGIRLALGATPRTIRGQVLQQGAGLICVGVALGLLGALALSRGLSSLLFGVTSNDPATFLVVAALLSAAGLLACSIPARRAASVDPIEVLRNE